MMTAIISTLFFSLLYDSSEGPWFAATASIYLGAFLVQVAGLSAKVPTLSDRSAEHARRTVESKIVTAEDAARGPLGASFVAGLVVRYTPLLPGPEWVPNAAAYATVFVCSALAGGFIMVAAGVDLVASEAQK